MTPGKVWNGEYEANGGYLIVKDTGDVVCYHLYDKRLFENYLFYNTCLETPAPERYNFGELSSSGRFKLNLQIRFASGR